MTSPNDLKRIKVWLGGNPNSSIHAISKATGISFYLVKKAMEELDAAKEVTWDFSTRTWSMAKKVEDLARDVEAKVEELEAGQADQQAPLAPSPDPTPTPQLTVVPPPELQEPPPIWPGMDMGEDDEEEGEEITIMPEELPKPIRARELRMELQFGSPLLDPQRGRIVLPAALNGATIMVDITDAVTMGLLPPGGHLTIHTTIRRH